MPEVGRLTAILDADASKLDREVKNAQKTLGGLGDSSVSASGKMKSLDLGMLKVAGAAALAGVALMKVGQAVWSSVEAFDEAQRSALLLANAFKATGKSDQSEVIVRAATALQNLTTVEDDAAVGAGALLVRFGATADGAAKLLPRIADLSAALGMDFEGATTLVGRALQGNTETLGRYGIKLDDATKSILETGTATEKLDALTRSLDGAFKGAAEALAETPVGKLEQLKNAWGGLKEEVGAFFSPALIAAIGATTEALRAFMRESDPEKMNAGEIQDALSRYEQGRQGMSRSELARMRSLLVEVQAAEKSAADAATEEEGRASIWRDAEAAARKTSDHMKDVAAETDKAEKAATKYAKAMKEAVEARFGGPAMTEFEAFMESVKPVPSGPPWSAGGTWPSNGTLPGDIPTVNLGIMQEMAQDRLERDQLERKNRAVREAMAAEDALAARAAEKEAIEDVASSLGTRLLPKLGMFGEVVQGFMSGGIGGGIAAFALNTPIAGWLEDFAGGLEMAVGELLGFSQRVEELARPDWTAAIARARGEMEGTRGPGALDVDAEGNLVVRTTAGAISGESGTLSPTEGRRLSDARIQENTDAVAQMFEDLGTAAQGAGVTSFGELARFMQAAINAQFHTNMTINEVLALMASVGVDFDTMAADAVGRVDTEVEAMNALIEGLGFHAGGAAIAAVASIAATTGQSFAEVARIYYPDLFPTEEMDEVGEAASDAAEGLRELARDLNIPLGFRYRLASYGAEDPTVLYGGRTSRGAGPTAPEVSGGFSRPLYRIEHMEVRADSPARFAEAMEREMAWRMGAGRHSRFPAGPFSTPSRGER